MQLALDSHRQRCWHCHSLGARDILSATDQELHPQVLFINAANYSKGILSEILDFVMGSGMIPADGEVSKVVAEALS
jgi:beta-ring hydroxylase